MIELKQVSRTYRMGGQEIRALDQVDLVVDDGEFAAVVGPSGSGKSTLLQVIGGLPALGSAEGGVAFWAHVGGFIIGVLLAMIYKPRPRVVQTYYSSDLNDYR